jgi:hypothetical protein
MIKVGGNLTNFGPGASPDSRRSWAEVSESLGYHLSMTCDHIGLTTDVHGRYLAPLSKQQLMLHGLWKQLLPRF